MLVEVIVETVARDQKNGAPLVILRDASGDRRFPIWIGEAEAQVIALALTDQRYPRPLTQDLLVAVFKALEARLQRVEISDLVENTYYAKLFLEHGDQTLCIDARPSDSIALALKAKAKIFAEAKLFSGEIESLMIGSDSESEPSGEQRADELRDFIENLDPKNFGKFRF